ncbi:MAG: nucleotidyltransferase domain-containing protein [Desulfomonilaceae bacterium]
MTTADTVTDTMIEEIVQAIVAAAAPEKIILFGSAAHGETGPDSDVDLLVVEKESSFHKGSRWAESSRIRKALWNFPIAIDVLIFTPEEVDMWKDTTNHIVARSAREGRVVYDRP